MPSTERRATPASTAPRRAAPAPAPARRRGASGLAALLAVAACGSGCDTLSPPPPASPPTPAPVVQALQAPVLHTVYVPVIEPQDLAARHLLGFQERIAGMPAAELSQEITRLVELNNGPGNGGNGGGSAGSNAAGNAANPASANPQTLLDLALALGQTRNPADVVRAQGLVDQVLRNPAAQPWHGMARLLAVRYGEQRRVDEQGERLAQQLRDAQRDSQRRLEQVNEKLEALKAIERSLNSRGVSPAAPAAAATPAPAPARPRSSP